ncbi:MAG: EF-Tu/IF-2/RF-3 family GTPase [Candidatus Methylomirabilia bacterium]
MRRSGVAEERTMTAEEKVGIVTGYYAKIGVAAIRLTDGELRVGDQVHIRGHTTDLTQSVDSLQVEHQPVERAERGSEVAVKVLERVRAHDEVLRTREG